MPIKKIEYQNLSLVTISDPIDINKLSIDNLKSKVPFDFISYVTREVLLLGAAEKKIRVTLQSNRFEFIDENRSPFNERDFSYLKDIFDSLTATLTIKAFGINIFESVILSDVNDTGKFLADKFLKDKDKIEKNIGKSIFSHSIRLFFGEKGEYFDLRLNPLELQKETMGVHFHYHNDTNIVDIEKLIQKITEKKNLTIKILPEILNKTLGL